MTSDSFPTGQEMTFEYPEFTAHLTLHSRTEMSFEIREGPFAHSEIVAIDVVFLGNSLFVVSWKEQSGATVTHIQDYDRHVVHAYITMPGGELLRLKGRIVIDTPAGRASDAKPERNKQLVVEAMTALFQRRDAAAVGRLYAPDYIQHNPGIPQGRDALASLVGALSPDVFYEPGMVIAEGNFVAIHGRIRGWAPTPQIVVDLFRIENGRLAEHWDVLQDEVATAESGGTSMFAPDERSKQTSFDA